MEEHCRRNRMSDVIERHERHEYFVLQSHDFLAHCLRVTIPDSSVESELTMRANRVVGSGIEYRQTNLIQLGDFRMLHGPSNPEGCKMSTSAEVVVPSR